MRIYIFILCRIHSSRKEDKRRRRGSWGSLEIRPKANQKGRKISSTYLGANLKTNLKSNNICLATSQNHQDPPLATTSLRPKKLQSQKEIYFRSKTQRKKLTYSLTLSFPRRKRKQSQRRRKQSQRRRK